MPSTNSGDATYVTAAGGSGTNAVGVSGQDITITMGAEIGRPSRLEIDTTGEILVGGSVVLSAKGHFLV